MDTGPRVRCPGPWESTIPRARLGLVLATVSTRLVCSDIDSCGESLVGRGGPLRLEKHEFRFSRSIRAPSACCSRARGCRGWHSACTAGSRGLNLLYEVARNKTLYRGRTMPNRFPHGYLAVTLRASPLFMGDRLMAWTNQPSTALACQAQPTSIRNNRV